MNWAREENFGAMGFSAGNGVALWKRLLFLAMILAFLPLLIPALLCFAVVMWLATDGLFLLTGMDLPPNETSPADTAAGEATQVHAWKRGLDILLVLAALPFLLPLMLSIAVLIWIVSDGPILFRQERVGHLGRRFMCFKFRTMIAGTDTSIHQGHLHRLISSREPMVKMDVKGDPRIIPLGVLLRSSGLDELPQIINVLRGEMSLVGPRPCLPYELDKYLPWQQERFNTLPGLTGLWQVSGKNRTTFDEMIQLDIDYARGKTLWFDLKIIFKTIPALIIQMLETRRERRALLRSTMPAGR
jgi:lipopolysaccharide/colanic/teichoic acid biosynthesis glycosyltransferase